MANEQHYLEDLVDAKELATWQDVYLSQLQAQDSGQSEVVNEHVSSVVLKTVQNHKKAVEDAGLRVVGPTVSVELLHDVIRPQYRRVLVTSKVKRNDNSKISEDISNGVLEGSLAWRNDEWVSLPVLKDELQGYINDGDDEVTSMDED